MCKNLHLGGGGIINGNGWNGWQFFLRIGAVPPTIRLHRVTLKK